MKYIVLLGDGMADRPIDALGGRTPLQCASTPNMDMLASKGITGAVSTIPDGYPPGSDVANLSILGYDPGRYYSGRAPLEAASMGIALSDKDVAYRCNLVCLGAGYGQGPVMEDYSSGHIGSDEARELIVHLNTTLGGHREGQRVDFYPGVSYRHLMVWQDGCHEAVCTPPHDITGRQIAPYLPSGNGSEFLRQLMTQSVDILNTHQVNLKRIADGKRPANSIWLWGQGKRPYMPHFKDIYGLEGALISAVDLTKGLGVYAGLKVIDVPGVTGYLDTNYEGKAAYAVEALRDADFVYVHVEAPDEAGHSGNIKDKIQAIEDFDRRVVGRVLSLLKDCHSDFRLLVLPDHATPISVKTHTREPVPFILYDSRRLIEHSPSRTYDETIVQMNGILFVKEGHTLMELLIKD